MLLQRKELVDNAINMNRKAFVTDLKYRDILEIAQCFERSYSYDGWREIAKQIALCKDNMTAHEIEYLKFGQMIEESACWSFIQSLSTKFSICNTTTFRRIALKFRRLDICYFLDTLGDISKNVWELSITEQKELVYFLDKKMVCGYGWKMFADELNYSASEINNFNPRFQKFEQPTVLLFNILTSKYPEMELQEIIRICHKANRHDVAKILRTLQASIIDNKTKS